MTTILSFNPAARRTARIALILVAEAALLYGCAKDDVADNAPDKTPGSGSIRFDIGFAPTTRMATDVSFESTWEKGDAIGIYAVEHGKALASSGNYIHNVKLAYEEGDWKLDEGNELWWPSAGGKLDFYAYYPYDNNGGAPDDLDPTAIKFNVLDDQSGTTEIDGVQISNYGLSDLLAAMSDNNGNGYAQGSTVVLNFSHMLALIEVAVPSQGKGWGPSETTYLNLSGVRTDATLNLGRMPAVALGTNGTAENVRMCRVEKEGSEEFHNSYTYRALVPAQEFASGSRIFRLNHEGRQLFLDAPLTDKVTLTAGDAATFTREMPATALHTEAIVAGKFQLGSPEGETGRHNDELQHWVTLTKNFRMTRYEITAKQYAAFLNAKQVPNVTGDVKFKVEGFDGLQILFKVNKSWTPSWNYETRKWISDKDTPMIYVSWFGAKAYADWVGGSLPTEAQWEYACRGGTTSVYSFPNEKIDDYAVYSNNKAANGPNDVGTKKPNPSGLYDMHGNVWEWCQDWYEGYWPDEVIDPQGPEATFNRVCRGGSWSDDMQECRSACRNLMGPTLRKNNIGFRVVFNE